MLMPLGDDNPRVHIDIAEEGVDYNVVKYNELGKAEFVNPNLDVAYLEAWFAVDENTPVILEIPKIKGLYYTAQLCDAWAEIITNINERNYPNTPYGKFALVLKGSNPEIPEDAVRVEVPSKKVKLLGRVERQGDDERENQTHRNCWRWTPKWRNYCCIIASQGSEGQN